MAIHEYFSVEWDIVWVAATQDAHRVQRQAGRILVEE
jgi:uncharacterized protein with HEPN domain